MRLFFALWPPPEVSRPLAAMAGELAERHGGRPQTPDKLHLTLAFLGEVSDAQCVELQQSLRGLRVAPFVLSVDRLGYWPRQRLLWAGLGGAPAELENLADALGCAAREVGIAFERLSFFPHLTLVRKVLNPPSPELGSIAGLSWACGDYALARSELAPAGARYEVVGEYPLLG